MKQLLLVLVAACSAPAGGTSDAGDDAAVASVPGLRGVYYAGARDPVADRVDPMLDLSWTAEPAPGVGTDDFAVRWTGMLTPPEAGTYGFALDADDGARLWLDGVVQIDAWSDGAHATDFVDIALSTPVAIKLAYYQHTGAAHVTLRWRRPDGTIEVVPTGALAAEPAGPPPGSPLPPYQNSVDPSGCADPGALAAGDTYYLACTGGRFQIRTSRDLVTWTPSGKYILPAGGAPWSSTADFRWAPEIHAVGTSYVAYFVSADGQGRRAIGAASAPSPLGPYTLQATPLLTDTIGVIDPTYFADDDGRGYLIYKQA
ncbi:MAG: family 43 glycosylhydrolase, partial [Kofleriaceae bacterium]